jgi:hypothetical protein
MPSNYIIQRTQSSYCPNCSDLVYLLTDKDGKQVPAFYICWKCQSIAEIGKGPIKKE